MKEEKFKIIQFIREFALKIENELINFPKQEIEIKRRIREETYDMLDMSYLANTTLDVELKKRLIEKIIAKAKTIDFLINLSLDRKLINRKLITGKKYVKFGNILDDITKYSNGWLNVMVKPKKED